jgi:hypothetical protein
MLEQNSTFWLDCPLTGHKQVFLTSGLVLGPFPLELFVRSLQLGAGSAGICRERWLWLLRVQRDQGTRGGGRPGWIQQRNEQLQDVQLSLWSPLQHAAIAVCTLRSIFVCGTYAWVGSTANGLTVSTTQNGFTTAAGGGLDIEVNRHIAVKRIQVEYVMSQLPQFGTNLNSIQSNLRYSAGVVLHLGAK